MKVLLIALESINNAGDEMLRETTEFLIKKTNPDCEIKTIQLEPNFFDLSTEERCISFKSYKVIFNVFYYLRLHNIYPLLSLFNRIRYKRYYRYHIKWADKIILPIGMLKFATQDFSYYFYLINSVAESLQKPVLMSAMSVARPDFKDWRFKQVVKAVNTSAVKSITTRDGIDGFERLKAYYLHHKCECDYVGDPALWAPDAFGYQTSDTKKDRPIGIGLIRRNIYSAYGDETFDGEHIVSMYKEIIKELETRGYDFVLFCNGMKTDYSVGEQLIQELHLPKNKLMPRPQNAKELVEMIGGFKAVFGARLHSCITSVALGVPVVGLLWDDKLRYFSKTMGISDFFLTTSELTGVNIIDKIEAAINYNFDFENRNNYKQKTLKSIESFLN